MGEPSTNEFMVACAVGTFLHPFTHAKILIQLGHEPDPPFLRETITSLFGIGKKSHYYPSVFTYCRRIREEIGVFGLFTVGLPAKLLSTIIQTSVAAKVKKFLLPDEESDGRQKEKYIREYIMETNATIVASAVGTIVGYPFHVVMVRQIAQFVGKETEYNSIISSIKEIWSNEGILGFYSGLVPRLIGDILLIALGGAATYTMNKYIFADRVAPDIKAFTPTISNTLVSSFVYKYTVVANLMSVNNSRLEVAMKFASTKQCYQYLKRQGALNRGGSLLFRVVPRGNL